MTSIIEQLECEKDEISNQLETCIKKIKKYECEKLNSIDLDGMSDDEQEELVFQVEEVKRNLTEEMEENKQNKAKVFVTKVYKKN